MVVYAVGKPHLLQIKHKTFIIRVVLAAIIILIDVFKCCADCEVVFTILICQDVAAIKSRLCQIINQLFLLDCKLLEVWHFVAQHFNVSKSVHFVIEI